MTRRPVPPSRPWFSRLARLARVPGQSLAYQPRISRTRSFMFDAPPLRCRLRPAAATEPAAGPAAPAPLAAHAVAEIGESRLLDPADLLRIHLRVAVEAEPMRLSVVVEMYVQQHVAPAAGAAGHPEARLGARTPHAPSSCTMPMAASSRSM